MSTLCRGHMYVQAAVTPGSEKVAPNTRSIQNSIFQAVKYVLSRGQSVEV